jgi:cytochrome c2
MVSTAYKRLVSLTLGLVLIVSGLLLVVPASLAGGWAVITLNELPAQVVAERPIEIGFMVRQHGRTPLEGLLPEVKARHTASHTSLAVTAQPQGDPGHYVAKVMFPQPGQWDWSIQAFTMDEAMPALNVLAAVPAETTNPDLPWTSLLMGVLGVIGTAGTGFIWWHKRAWWAVPLVCLTLALGVTGFVRAAGHEPSVEPQAAHIPTQAEMGAGLFVAKGCVTCHRHNDINVSARHSLGIGPNLTNFSAAPEYLKMWLHDPTAIKPQTQMPNLHLTETEIEALIAFLLDSAAAPEKPLSQATSRQAGQ